MDDSSMMIRLVKREDLKDLAVIYKDLYDDVDIGEDWSIEKSLELLSYWYDKQGDLFFVAEEDGRPVGAIVSGVKSWFDGLRLVDTEIFVKKDYQQKCIGTKLMLEHLKQAKIKYNVMKMEFHTYGDENNFPQTWYNTIWFKKDDELIIMNGDVENILNKLWYDISDVNNTEKNKNIINYSYDDLMRLYSNLKRWDTAYIFDMLPEYAYVDTSEEKWYIESRITAMKNGANVSLFIVGNKEKIDNFASNELYNYAVNSCYWDGKIFIVDEDEIKNECPNEFFQLAYGLYYWIYADGSKEAFRDLWINSDNIGVLIKDNSILNYIEKSIFAIIELIKRK